jgi:hypothetical protein
LGISIKNNQTKRNQSQTISANHGNKKIARKNKKKYRNHKQKNQEKKTSHVNSTLHVKLPINENQRRNQRNTHEKPKRHIIKNNTKRNLKPMDTKQKIINHQPPTKKQVRKTKQKNNIKIKKKQPKQKYN